MAIKKKSIGNYEVLAPVVGMHDKTVIIFDERNGRAWHYRCGRNYIEALDFYNTIKNVSNINKILEHAVEMK